MLFKLKGASISNPYWLEDTICINIVPLVRNKNGKGSLIKITEYSPAPKGQVVYIAEKRSTYILYEAICHAV